jgi:hypothetical protein
MRRETRSRRRKDAAARPTEGKTMSEARELFGNPKFVALWVAIWFGLLLAVENIVTKIGLLMQLTQ